MKLKASPGGSIFPMRAQAARSRSYVITYSGRSPVAFLTQNPGGRFKGKDPTVSKSALEANPTKSSATRWAGRGTAHFRQCRQKNRTVSLTMKAGCVGPWHRPQFGPNHGPNSKDGTNPKWLKTLQPVALCTLLSGAPFSWFDHKRDTPSSQRRCGRRDEEPAEQRRKCRSEGALDKRRNGTRWSHRPSPHPSLEAGALAACPKSMPLLYCRTRAAVRTPIPPQISLRRPTR